MFTVFSFAASSTSIFAISIERFLAISHPLFHRKHLTKSFANILIAISWIYASLIGLTLLLDGNVRERFERKCILTTIVSSKMLFYYCLEKCLGCVMLAVLYVLIFKKILSQVSSQSRKTSTSRLLIN